MSETRTYGGWLELSRANLVHNLAGITNLAEPARVMAVLKANAYGAGATGMARLLRNAGVTRFAVATLDEAVELREAGIDGRILCLTYFDGGDATAMGRHDLTVSVSSDAQMALLGEASLSMSRPVRVWIKVDTGLGRLGVPHGQAAAFIERVLDDPRLAVEGVYSTLTESRERDRCQLARLLAVRAALPAMADAEWSLASSHGMLSLPESRLDVVRPGVTLLGLPPSPPQRLDAGRLASADLKPVVTWKARVAAVKTLPAGERVGYGEQDALTRDTRVASVMVGWANGYPGSPERHSHVLLGGRRCAVLDVSANTTLVDASGIEAPAAGQEAVLLGAQNAERIGADELGAAAPGVYRLLAGIPARAARIWID